MFYILVRSIYTKRFADHNDVVFQLAVFTLTIVEPALEHHSKVLSSSIENIIINIPPPTNELLLAPEQATETTFTIFLTVGDGTPLIATTLVRTDPTAHG